MGSAIILTQMPPKLVIKSECLKSSVLGGVISVFYVLVAEKYFTQLVANESIIISIVSFLQPSQPKAS